MAVVTRGSRPTTNCVPVAIGSLVLLAAFIGAEAKTTDSAETKTAVSAMLLGSIMFIMVIFYLVNHSDVDIKFYACSIVANTVSIFSAVLFYQAIHAYLEHYDNIWVDFVHMLFWVIAVQFATAWLSGALSSKQPPEATCGMGDADKKLLQKREDDCACFATLLAHLAGFAAITFFGDVQHQPTFKSTWATAGLSLSVVMIICYLMFKGGKIARMHAVQVHERQRTTADELWHEQAEDAENDVVALAASFLTLQVQRFAVTGKLPNVEGDLILEAHDADMKKHEAFHHFCSLICWTVLLLMLRLSQKRIRSLRPALWEAQEKWLNCGFIHIPWMGMKRLMMFAQTYAMMCMAWTILYLFKVLARGYRVFDENDDGVLAKMMLALTVTFFSVALIFVFDKVADTHVFGEELDKVFRKINLMQGLLIGFSWEQCFDVAVGDLADSLTDNFKRLFPGAVHLPMRPIIAALVVILVVPAYRWYILPAMNAAKKAKDEADREHKAKLREDKSSLEALESGVDAIRQGSKVEPRDGAGREPLLQHSDK